MTQRSHTSTTRKTSANEPNTMASNTSDVHQIRPVVEAAAVAGAAAGMVVGGPFLSIASAAGIAYLASSDDGAIGEASRATGEAVLGMKDRAIEWEEKNGYLEKASETAKSKLEKAQVYEEKHHLLETLQQWTEQTFVKASAWAEKNRVVEKGQKAVAQGTAFAVSKLQECVRPGCQDRHYSEKF
jgi:hypothetical protein